MGAGPARVAHRVLGDGEEVPRACVRDPRRRQRPDLSAPRERDRSVARGRRWVRPDVDAQRDASADRREDVQVARQHRLAPRCDRTMGTGNDPALLHDRPVAQADRLRQRGGRAGARASRDLPQLLRGTGRRDGGDPAGRAGARARRRLQHAGGAGALPRLADTWRSSLAALGSRGFRPGWAVGADRGPARPGRSGGAA